MSSSARMFKLVVFLLQVTRQVFEASKGRLKVVGRAGVGVDNVDLAAATEVRRERGPGAVARKVGTWGDSWAQTSPQSLCLVCEVTLYLVWHALRTGCATWANPIY
jgi:hypothetical protein